MARFDDGFLDTPSGTGERTKRKQLEYDALGRLTSVCEITGGTVANPAGTCGQTTPQTGYWTKYTYDPLGNLTRVTQNGQQTRLYSYDWLSRLTSETTPEAGNKTYTYDSDSTCVGTFNGDLVKKVDAAGNVTCSAYDALHRVTLITYPSGPNTSSTKAKFFAYDTPYYGSTGTNIAGRLVAAGTCQTSSSCAGSSVVIEEFGYSPRGELTDIWESTPNSGGWYHINQTYWPNGAPNQLSTGIAGLPTSFTYGVDSQGRSNSTSAPAPAQSPVTNTLYNVFGQPYDVTFGSLDKDVFGYDSNTGRMTQYQFKIGATPQSVTGTLTWNANSTLQQLAISDPFNSTNNQICNYGYDDLVRLTSANCGSAASQTFSYDPFGNINKAGSPFSFNAQYAASSNHITSIGSFTPTYDGMGNVTNDGLHTYTWDAEGRPVVVDGVNVLYDASNRMAEQSRSGVYTQVVYSPMGDKLALTNGQTLQKAFIPLPGGATAIYTSSGLDHYRHPDWLGSARLTSSPTQTTLSSVAYAPFGEPYAQFGTPDLSFTTQNQDTVGAEYDFLARQYGIQGRWPSPDPLGIDAADLSNPQSFNLYAYVSNSPLVSVDPLGLMLFWSPWDDVLLGGGGGGIHTIIVVTASADDPLSDLIKSFYFGHRGDVIITRRGEDPEEHGGSDSGVTTGGSSKDSGMILGPSGPCTPSVFNPDCKRPTCWAVFSNAAEAADPLKGVLPPLPSGAGVDDAVKMAATAVAVNRVVSHGLVKPLSSGFVRNVVMGGELLANAVVLVPTIYQGSLGIYAEAKARNEGTCRTAWESK